VTTATGWTPTHRVPAGGLPTWAAPNPQTPSQAPLAAGLEVMLLQSWGDWGQVRCANGWETWVAAPGLVALAPADRPASRRRLAALAVAVAALAAVAFAATQGGGDDQEAAPTATSAPARDRGLGVRLQLPPGWVLSADGLRAASTRAALDSPAPTGPRVRAVEGTGPAEEVFGRLAAARAVPETSEVVAPPAAEQIGGRPAVAVTLRDTGDATPVIRRYLASESPAGVPVLFVLEAPADQFDAHAATLAGVPGWT
jgi:hypothetical protein